MLSIKDAIKSRKDPALEPGLRNSLLSGSASTDPAQVSPSVPENEMSGDERRLHARRRVVWKASLQCSHHNFECHVMDLSMTGARLKLDIPLARNYGIVLSIPGVAPLTARTVWYSNGLLGIEFIGKLNYIETQLGKRLTASRPSHWK